MKSASPLEVIFLILIILLTATFVTLFKNIIAIILFIGIKLGIKSAKKDKLNDIDFGKYKDYYRDIIRQYSPAVLSYIDDFEVNSNKDIISTLLNLKLKKYININETDIQILENDQNNLDETERYILNNKGNYNMITFKDLVIKDAIKNGLIKEQKDIIKKIKRKAMLLIVMFVLLQVLFSVLPKALYMVLTLI